MSMVNTTTNDAKLTDWIANNVAGACVMSHINESCHIPTSHVTYQWVMTHINESSDIWMSHVTYEWVIWMRVSIDMNESIKWYEWEYQSDMNERIKVIWMRVSKWYEWEYEWSYQTKSPAPQSSHSLQSSDSAIKSDYQVTVKLQSSIKWQSSQVAVINQVTVLSIGTDQCDMTDSMSHVTY